MITITVQDRGDGSVFDLDVNGGSLALDCLFVTEAPDGTDRRVYRVVGVDGTQVTADRQSIAHGVVRIAAPPPTRVPNAAPIVAYGNNVTVRCPCGATVMARSLGKKGGGAYKCSCGRHFKGFPDEGQRIDFVHVWEPGDNSALGTYRVAVAPALHQAPPVTT